MTIQPGDRAKRARLTAGPLVLLALAGVSACTQVAYPPPSDALRARFGAVAVVLLASQGPVAPDSPVKGKGEGALSGAGQGAVGSLAGGATFCHVGEPLVCAFGLALGIAAAPVAALVGAGVGAERAHPAAEVDAAEASLRAALDQAMLAETLAEQVRLAATGRTTRVLAPPPVTDHDTQLPDFSDLAESGADTVLQLEVTRFGLASAGHIDPDLTLALSVRGRLLDAADGRLLYMRAWAYRGHPYNYFDMAADEASQLRAELQRGIERLTAGIVLDLFVVRTPELRRSGKIPHGTVRTIDSWSAPTVDGGDGARRAGLAAPAGSASAPAPQRPKWASMRSKAVSMVSSETQ